MKQISFLLLAAFFSVILFSCQKENSNNSSSNNTNKLKLYVEDATNTSIGAIDTFTVSYDGNNRITGLTSPNLKFVYAYSNGSFTMDLYDYSQLSIHEIFYLNNTPLVDSTLQYDNAGDTTTEKYIYNGSTLLKYFSYNYTKAGGAVLDTEDDYTYDAKGNVTQDIQLDGNGDINTVATTTYTDKPLTFSTQPFYIAAQAKNLPATKTVTDGSGNPVGKVTFSYVFDAKGRVIKETDEDNNGESVVKTYVYL